MGERTISMLKLLKTSLGSTVGNDRLVLMLIHRDVELNPAAAVEEFSCCYPYSCGLLFINPFSE